MDIGAFALIDCLGFKGVWRGMPNGDASPLIDKMLGVQTELSKMIASKEPPFDLEDVEMQPIVSLLSDTVAISVITGTHDPIISGSAVSFISKCVIQILELFLETEPRFAMRGCVSYGEHLASGNFIVGPAVDEAAEHMDIAEGAFVWLLPSAQRHFEANTTRYLQYWQEKYESEVGQHLWGIRSFEELQEEYLYINPWVWVVPDYPMPIKGGRVIDVSIINPYITSNTGPQQHLSSRIQTIMASDRIDVWIKRQNTLKFLEVAEHFYFRQVDLAMRGMEFETDDSSTTT